MRFEFRPIFKGIKFKPVNYRKMMKTVSRVLIWILILVFVVVLLIRRFHVLTR
jgi:hypothetical protein